MISAAAKYEYKWRWTSRRAVRSARSAPSTSAPIASRCSNCASCTAIWNVREAGSSISAVVLTGVGIDLRQDGSANALPTPAPQASARASFSTNYPVDMSLVDETALQPGASIAAYDTSVDSPADRPPAAAAQPLADGDALDPGASVAAYGI